VAATESRRLLILFHDYDCANTEENKTCEKEKWNNRSSKNPSTSEQRSERDTPCFFFFFAKEREKIRYLSEDETDLKIISNLTDTWKRASNIQLQTRQNILQHKNRACKTPAENAGPTHPLQRTKAAAAANSKKKEKPKPKDESPRTNANPKDRTDGYWVSFDLKTRERRW
jgi:hypothetical protein